MDSKPLVSICLPVYNKPYYLNKALKSLSNQIYNKIEIIISDDCSPDKTVLDVINSWLQKDNRIRFYQQKQNIGEANNYLYLLKKALGKYALIASDDDLWHKNYIKEGINFLENNPEYDIWNSSVYDIDSYGRIIYKHPPIDRFNHWEGMNSSIIQYSYEPEIYGKCLIFQSLYKKEKIEELVSEYFITKDKPWSDYTFSLFVLLKARFYGSNKYLLYKRWVRESDKKENFNPIIIKNPWKSMMLINLARIYTFEHFRVLKGSDYRFFVVLILLFRLVITYILFIKDQALISLKLLKPVKV